MKDENNESSVAATGIGAVLAGVLSLFARSADDVARMGVHCIDDVGRACVTTSDDIGSLMARSGDDLVRPIDDFCVASYADDLRFDPAQARLAINEGEGGFSATSHFAKEIAEATFKIADLNGGDGDE